MPQVGTNLVYSFRFLNFYGYSMQIYLRGTYPLKPLRLLTGEEVLTVAEVSLEEDSETIEQNK